MESESDDTGTQSEALGNSHKINEWQHMPSSALKLEHALFHAVSGFEKKCRPGAQFHDHDAVS